MNTDRRSEADSRVSYETDSLSLSKERKRSENHYALKEGLVHLQVSHDSSNRVRKLARRRQTNSAQATVDRRIFFSLLGEEKSCFMRRSLVTRGVASTASSSPPTGAASKRRTPFTLNTVFSSHPPPPQTAHQRPARVTALLG